MFLLNEMIISPSSIFNEAEGDTPTSGITTSTPSTSSGTTSTSSSSTSSSTSEDGTTTETSSTSTEETTTMEQEEPNDEEYQMDMGDDSAGMDDMSGGDTGGDNSYQDSSSSSGMGADSEVPEPTKKYVMLEQYKELLETTNKLIVNIEKYMQSASLVLYDDIMYIVKQGRELEKRITFTIVNKFDKYDYQKLLTLFYYYQNQMSNLTELVEKIIDSETDE